MKKLYLHTGLDKTGSTSIQFSCVDNVKLLEEQGVVYPIPTFIKKKNNNQHRQFNHSPMVGVLFSDPNHRIWKGQLSNIGYEINEVRNYYMNFLTNLNKDKDIILSAESVPTLNEGQMLEFKEFLRDNFPLHKIIPFAYVRSPYSQHCSGLQQRIKSGMYCCYNSKTGSRLEMIRKLRKLYDDIVFYPYNKLSKETKNIVKHFNDLIGIDVPLVETRENEGLSNKCVREINEKNKVNPSFLGEQRNPSYVPRWWEELSKKYKNDSKFLLTKKELASKKSFLDETNKLYEMELGKEFCDDLYPTCD
jgi:hypothetical protein